MHSLKYVARLDGIDSSFNSLLEMHTAYKSAVALYKEKKSFNSLLEMPIAAPVERGLGGFVLFQFSIGDASTILEARTRLR